MGEMTRRRVARRDFVRQLTVAIAMGGVALRPGARETLAQIRRFGRPPLTEVNLNALIPQSRPAFEALAAQARNDIKGFILSRFKLTPSQTQQLQALTPSEVAAIGRAIDFALQEGKGIRVRFFAQTSRSDDDPFVVRLPAPIPGWVNNVYVDGEIEQFKVVVGVKGSC